jgi:hypothetical protein
MLSTSWWTDLRECGPVKLLRRVLLWQAALWAAFGVAMAVVPGTVLVDLFGQAPPVDAAFARLAGIAAFCLALNMVLVAQRIEDIWWFSWTFVVLEVGTIAVSLANALGARPAGSGALLWWLLTVVGVAFLALLIAGLAKTGTETPPG